MEHKGSLDTLSMRGEQNLDIKSALHTIESHQPAPKQSNE